MGRESSEMTAECFRFTWKSPRFEFVASVSHREAGNQRVLDSQLLAEQLGLLIVAATGERPTGCEWSSAPFQAPLAWVPVAIKRLENARIGNLPHPSDSSQSPPDDSDTHLE